MSRCFTRKLNVFSITNVLTSFHKLFILNYRLKIENLQLQLLNILKKSCYNREDFVYFSLRLKFRFNFADIDEFA